MAMIDTDNLSNLNVSVLVGLQLKIRTALLIKQGEEFVCREVYSHRVVNNTPNLVKNLIYNYNERGVGTLRDRTLEEILSKDEYFNGIEDRLSETFLSVSQIDCFLKAITEEETGNKVIHTRDNIPTYPYNWHERIKAIAKAMAEMALKLESAQ